MFIRVSGKFPHQEGIITPLFFDLKENPPVEIVFTNDIRLKSGEGRFYCREKQNEILLRAEQLTPENKAKTNAELRRLFCYTLDVRVVESRWEVSPWQLVHGGLYIERSTRQSDFLCGIFTVSRREEYFIVSAPDNTYVQCSLTNDEAQIVGGQGNQENRNGTTVRVKHGKIRLTYYENGVVKDEILIIRSV